jgi:hypothetical protein
MSEIKKLNIDYALLSGIFGTQQANYSDLVKFASMGFMGSWGQWGESNKGPDYASWSEERLQKEVKRLKRKIRHFKYKPELKATQGAIEWEEFLLWRAKSNLKTFELKRDWKRKMVWWSWAHGIGRKYE